jgi:predicted O-methyltransferase YrrM
MNLPRLSSVFADLHRRYEREGLEVYGCFSPYLNAPRVTGTYVARGETFLSTSGGISNEEATFIYALCEELAPRNILVIGNSYGFSTVFLALSNPDAKLIAFDKYRTEGIKTTNRLLSGLKDKEVIQASTPDDIPKIIEDRFGGTVDLVLIDAVHTNEVQTAEFKVLNRYLSEKSIVVFHDVLSCNLLSSFYFLQKTYGDYEFSLITKSSSGIAVCVKGESSKDLRDLIRYHSTIPDKVLDFSTLMLKSQGVGSDLFPECESRFNFLPHPQL